MALREYLDVELSPETLALHQQIVSREAKKELEVQLLAKEEIAIRKGEASNPKARVAYLKGRLFLAKRTHDAYLKAIEYFEEALAIEPGYARGFTGLADMYSLMVGFISASEGCEKAKAYTQQALALDPSCAEAHATLGYVIWHSKKEGCDETRSIELSKRREDSLCGTQGALHPNRLWRAVGSYCRMSICCHRSWRC